LPGPIFLTALIFIGLAGLMAVQGAVTPAPGFTRIASGTGVAVYQKTYSNGPPDYVTVIDLRSGTLRNFTGSVSGPNYSSNIERRSLRSFWDFAVSQNRSDYKAIAAINGTFFSQQSDPTPIAFGLKADWWIMSYGYGVTNEPGTKYTLAFDSSFGSSSIQPYNSGTFDAGIPNVIGGYDPWFNKDGRMNSFIPRTYVGVRDDNGDGHSETVMFFNSAEASQSWAINILQSFGCGSKMMLDGEAAQGLY
jgi:hypothetical protein